MRPKYKPKTFEQKLPGLLTLGSFDFTCCVSGLSEYVQHERLLEAFLKAATTLRERAHEGQE